MVTSTDNSVYNKRRRQVTVKKLKISEVVLTEKKMNQNKTVNKGEKGELLIPSPNVELIPGPY